MSSKPKGRARLLCAAAKEKRPGLFSDPGALLRDEKNLVRPHFLDPAFLSG
jgi:hypothetical protein